MMSAMKIRHQLRYEASPDDVFAMLSDRAFRERVCAAMNVVSSDISIQEIGQGLTIRIDMNQRTTGLPSVARKFTGDETRIIQTERWTGGRVADLEVEIPGKPGRIHGRTTLTADGDGTIESFEGETKVNLPLIGGKLEGLIQGLFVHGMDAEHRVGTAWLSEASR
jgi:uncharacterized protein DUF2505